MGYRHIENLYKNQKIMTLCKQCYATEKIHGTSAHICYKTDRNLGFFSGGSEHNAFVALFDQQQLKARLGTLGLDPSKSVYIYGEAYGGKLQGMSGTYGKDLKFIVFEVKIGDKWLSVPDADDVAQKLGLEYVAYSLIDTSLTSINAERDAPSVQAMRNGMGDGWPREGIVLRPLKELTLNNDERLVAKHKNAQFCETKTIHEVSPEKIKAIEDARAIAEEWVTSERLNHILTSGILEAKIENTGKVIAIMIEDVLREAKGEIIDSPQARKEIARCTALAFKRGLQENLQNENS